MGLAVTTPEVFASHLEALGLREGMDVVVHSRLTAFGQLPQGVQGVYQSIRDIVGPSATIAVPAYRLHTAGSEGFDRMSSPGERVGVLSDYVRQLPGAVRSACPMHSHAAVGPKARLLETVTGAVSMGERSDFDLLHKAGFSALLLGCEFPESASFIVHVQAVLGNIPYRQWFDLSRPQIINGHLEPFTCRYYGRVDRGTHVEDWNVGRDILRAAGKLRAAPCPYGTSYAFSLADMFDLLTRDLRANPSALLVQSETAA